MTNNYLIIGAPNYPSFSRRGAVYTFNISSGALLISLAGQNNHDEFGSSIKMTNNYLIIDASGYPSGNFSGAVYAIPFCAAGQYYYFGSNGYTCTNCTGIFAPQNPLAVCLCDVFQYFESSSGLCLDL